MVNRVLTSPLLCYCTGDAAGGPAVHDVQDDPRVCLHSSCAGTGAARFARQWALAVRAAARADWRYAARQAADQSCGRRAAASDPAVRRAGHRRACRRVRPLSGEQGPRRIRRRRRATGSAAATSWSARSIRRTKCWCSTARARDFSSRRSPPRTGSTPRAGRAGDAHSQSVLCRLCRRRDRRRLRAGLSADHARDRLPAGPRCARATNCWRAPSRSTSLRRPIRRARSPTALISRS